MDKNTKKTIVLGVSPNKSRRAHMVCEKLMDKGHPIIPLGIKRGFVQDTPIITSQPTPEPVHTAVIYLRPERQATWISYILACKPHRIIFNPGTENEAFISKAKDSGIETLIECTYLMLSSNRF